MFDWNSRLGWFCLGAVLCSGPRLWAETGLPVIVPVVNLELEPIPAGNFTMGSPPHENGRNADEGPQRRITFKKYFWMGKYEVTQQQWLTLMGTNPSSFHGEGNLPVENITWAEAVSFGDKLTAQERAAGRLPAGYAYRLPTEAEWEYACRAGTTTRFYVGDKDSDLDAAGWIGPNSGGKTHPVGQKEPNAWGLYDMHGNVWEWCHDWYGPYSTAVLTDPQGPTVGHFHVVRGGGWMRSANSARSAERDDHHPSFKRDNVGFRIVLAPELPGAGGKAQE